MADPWGVSATEPYRGGNLGPLSPEGSPAGSKWGVVKTEPAAAAAPPAAAPASGGWLAKAVEPITSYPSTQRQMAGEAVGKMGEGVEALKERKLGKAAWDLGVGALDYTMSPVNAALRTIVGKPIEENT